MASFVGYLQEERYKDEDGRAVLAQTNRAEADRILSEVRQIPDQVASLGLRREAGPLADEARVTGSVSAADEEPGGDDDVELHRRIDRSRDLIRGEAPQSALRLIQSLEEELPSDVPPEITYHIAMNKGASLLMLDRTAEALAQYERALEAKPGDHRALEQKAQALLQVGDEADAKSSAEAVIGTNADSEIAWSVLIRLDPQAPVPDHVENSHPVQLARGLNAMRGRRPDEAVRHFRTALHAKPDDVQLKILLADALYMSSFEEEEDDEQ